MADIETIDTRNRDVNLLFYLPLTLYKENTI
jgi:hypothetical protein